MKTTKTDKPVKSCGTCHFMKPRTDKHKTRAGDIPDAKHWCLLLNVPVMPDMLRCHGDNHKPEAKAKAFTLIEVLVVSAIIMILWGVIAGGVGGCSRSEGLRSGTLVKFSYKGIASFTKSWEGDMALEGVGAATVANTWRFSVLDKAMADKLDPLVGKQVKVRYVQTILRNPLKRDTVYLVTSVEAVGAKKEVEK